MSTWIAAKVAWKKAWTPGLVSLRLDTRLQFKPGQFTNLGLSSLAGGQHDERERRAYSMASAPGEAAEFYANEVQEGGFSPQLLKLREGDPIWIDTKPSGFFTLDELPAGDDLWLLATGTGLAPYLSMLRSGEAQRHCSRVVVVHGVREQAQLGHRVELEQLAQQSTSFRFVPVLSREAAVAGGLAGRIPALIATGDLERCTGLTFDPARSRVLLCGNPQMIVDTRAMLEERGLKLHRRRAPGQILTENYW
ncbi:MAG TPA: ferredoxin--NADP reductase [Polyangiaceae bacterium]|nr:ferredoxin--NADP reductase [Polyangiaceae bacterium]